MIRPYKSILSGISIVTGVRKYLQLMADLTYQWFLDLTPPLAGESELNLELTLRFTLSNNKTEV